MNGLLDGSESMERPMRRKAVSISRELGGFARPEVQIFARAQFLVTFALVAVLACASLGSAALLTAHH